MNNRIESIKDSIRRSMKRPKSQWRAERSVFDAYPGAECKPLIMRNAMAVRLQFSEAPLSIWPGQLIAGGMVLEDSDVMLSNSLPDHATADEKSAAAKEGYSVGSIVGHIVPSYPKLLRLGTSGIKRDALEALSKLSGAATSSSIRESADFYEAVVTVMEAIEMFAGRYARRCMELSEAESCAARRAELRQMAEDLAFAPRNPAATFAQAVSSIWLVHLAFQLTGNHLAIGRFDQHVWPYLECDLAGGRIDLERAQEIVNCFFLKFNERALDNDIQRQKTDFEEANKKNEANWAARSPFAHSTQRFNARDSADATNHWLQNVIVGGVKPADGADASNPVTYMCLEAFDVNRMTNPCLTLRLHARTPAELYKKGCEALINGGGLPAFFNDEAIIPALTKWGIPPEDARDYTNDGCWEIIIAGRNDFYFDRFNMLRCLEWALNRGRSLMDGKKEAPDPGEPADFASYEAVYGAFLQMLEYVIDGLMAKNCREFGKRAKIAPVPMLSALLDGPMEAGFDMTRAGAKYITYGLIAEGVSHVIDSLAAVRDVIFRARAASIGELADALRQDYAGYEPLRRKLLDAPKYGRNQKEADELGARLIDDFAGIVSGLNSKYDAMIFLPGAGTFSWYIAIGEGCGASPDGRKSGEAVSSNFSPSAGAATNGVTGAVLSHASFDMTNLPVGSPTDLRVSSKHVSGAEGLNRLVGIVKSFVSLGGNMLTLSVADSAILRAAQEKPWEYGDLRIRMGGWSAYFTMLSKEQQEHHIAKQEAV